MTTIGPWAVIAGGSEGVGASFAEELARRGTHLVLVARKTGPLEETASRCRELGVEVRAASLDLTRAIVELTDDVEVGLLVHNAGADSHAREFVDGDLEAFHRLVALNVSTPLSLAHHFGRLMRDRGRGSIILVGSLAGYAGSARHSVYGGTKAFGRIFAEGLWLELREHGVDVLELVLGLTRTPAMARVGLSFDVPGLAVGEPDDVAREGLAALGNGPVHVISGNERTVEWRHGLDRAKVVLGDHRVLQKLLAVRPQDG